MKIINILQTLSIVVSLSAASLMAQEKPAMYSDDISSTYLYTDHWAYTYVQLLQDRGYLKELYYSVKPYKRIDLAKAVLSTNKDPLTASETYWLDLLQTELRTEIQTLVPGNNKNMETASTKVSLETKNYAQHGHFKSDFYFNPEINYTTDHVAVSLRGRIDNGLLNDPTYSGQRTDWVAARLEDGYGSFQFGKLDFFVGRAAHNWSPFLNKSLILSDNPYTYDQAGINFETKHIAFHSIFAKLNSTTANNIVAERYFSAHRLDLKFNSGINLGFSETVVYGGPNQALEFAYMNPFTIFMNAQTNDGKEANENLALDFFVPLRRFNFKGQILVDDFILDGPDRPAPNRKTSSDRLGLLLAVQGNDIFFQNSLWTLQYENIGSYTYNVKQKRPWQSYTYDGRGLGNPANDEDSWNLNIKYFPIRKWIFDLDAIFTRQGERDLASNNFEDSTFVKLPFPSGVVEKSLAISAGTLYQHNNSLFGEARIGLEHILNYKHIGKSNKTFMYLLCRINFILEPLTIIN